VTDLRNDPSEELVPGADGHADSGKAEAQALHAPDGAGDCRKNDVQHNVALEPVLVAVHDPAQWLALLAVLVVGVGRSSAGGSSACSR